MDLLQSNIIENPLVRQFFDQLQLSFLNEFDKDVAQPAITLKKRPSRFQIASHDEERLLSTETNGSDRLITYSWPGKSPYEAWKFSMWPLTALFWMMLSIKACVLRVLSLIIEAVQENLLITKRFGPTKSA